jgi:hypothetical protein
MRDWNVLTSRLHTATPPSDEEITRFVLATLKDDRAFPGSDRDVCSAGFFKIAASETESLVISIDVNGRHFCNDIEVIHRGPNGLTVQGIEAWDTDNVKDLVCDIGKNGTNVLVIPTALSDYEGANSCSGAWSRIFTMQAGVLADRSAAFREFYRERLHSLPAEMQKLRSRDPEDATGDNAICLQMESDKIRRFLGISPKAGEARAMQWINSRNEFLRRKGIAVLAGIGDQKSMEVLRSHTADPDPSVALAAKWALGRANE